MKKEKSTLFKVLSRSLFLMFALIIGSATGCLALGLGLAASPFVIRQASTLLNKPMFEISCMAFDGIIDPSDLTWNGAEIKSLSEAVYEEVFVKPKIGQTVNSLRTGIKAKTQIAFLGKLGLVGKKKGACEVTPNDGQISMSEKFWEPAYITDRFEQCWDTLKETFFVWGLANGIKKEDLTSSDFAVFFEERLKDSLTESVYRIAWFSDEDVEGYSDGALTAGTDADYFTPINGLWKQIFTIIASNTNHRVTVVKNSGVSHSAQEFDDTDTTNKVVTKYFQKLKFQADTRLRNMKGLVIICTQSMADQYERELSANNALESSFTMLREGVRVMTCGGIPVVPFEFWDRYIRAYYDDGTTYYLPHRAILTTIENIPIGTEEAGNLAEIDPFYDKVSKNYICDFGYNIDAKVLQDHLITAAY